METLRKWRDRSKIRQEPKSKTPEKSEDAEDSGLSRGIFRSSRVRFSFRKKKSGKSREEEEERFALEQKENELRLSKKRMNQMNELTRENHALRFALEQKETEVQKRKREASSCQRCEHQAQEHKNTMSEMEAFYKDKLTEARCALKEKDQEFRAFKDRVAENVALSLKTHNTENMKSPVNQSRLTEMYQQLRVCTWPNIPFTSSEPEARKLVQEMFAAAAENMKRLLSPVCEGKASCPKVEHFRQMAVENLQLALYHSSKQQVFQAAFPHFQKGAADFQLASECYWLGCLMALHSPPLYPKWDQNNTTVFPREMTLQR